MAIALGQHTFASVSSATSVTTPSVTTQASASTFVICESADTGETHSVQDAKGNTYTQIATTTSFASATESMWYKANGTGGASHTFTANTNTASSISVYAVEITGADTSTPLDQNNSQSDAASPFDSPTVTTTVANELLVGFGTGNAAVAADTFTAGNSFTLLDNVTDGTQFITGASSYRIVSATGNYNSDYTTAKSSTVGMWISTFKEAAAGSDTLMGQACL